MQRGRVKDGSRHLVDFIGKTTEKLVLSSNPSEKNLPVPMHKLLCKRSDRLDLSFFGFDVLN
jgi:hypothetical protein